MNQNSELHGPNAPGSETAGAAGAGTETAPATTGALRSWLRSWRYFFWLLALAILVALFYLEEDWRGKRAWEQYKAHLQARGERFDRSSFIPPAVPLSENFAMTPALAPLFEFIPGTQKWRSTNGLAAIQGFAPAYDAASRNMKTPSNEGSSNSWVAAHMDLKAWAQSFRTKGKKDFAFTNALADLSESQAAAEVLSALAECDPVLQEIQAASQKPSSRFDIKYHQDDPASILLPHLAVLKHLCAVLQLRASAKLALKQTEAAAQDVQLIFRLVKATRDEPIAISHVVRTTELRLALQPLAEGFGQWTEPQLRNFQERLLQFDFCSDM